MNSSYTRPAKGARALRRGRFSGRNQIYHITTRTREREPFFVNLMLGRIVVRSLQREDDAGHTQTLAFVVMPDHLHWLVQLTGTRSLSVSVNTVKSFAARSINQIMGRSGRVWQAGYYDHALRDEEDLAAVARYIVANPLRTGLTCSIADYPLWDAIWV